MGHPIEVVSEGAGFGLYDTLGVAMKRLVLNYLSRERAVCHVDLGGILRD